ncbi:hypothetical protein C8R45DRAFT_564231 [Mycena sanguinolenta]|nr:hypothetical protein C8R45DRAFT_564231 [Mycena sanguinolenta]
MDAGEQLETGNAPSPATRASVLYRLASAVYRVLRARETTNHPTPRLGAAETATHYPEKGNYSDAENEEACAKLWSIYVGEAERYDTALVESWKADMEGMLIFSGLFSASLTAFLIESYKILQPDSGALTVAAITQVSRQLVAIANNESYVSPPQSPFTPTTASLWCNALWFVSLSLSLTCALLATLVEQWSREFLHQTEMRPSPVRRARIFSFLYYGLKQFRMHIIVDVIPFLLHASLMLFFAGLVAFLLPVNPVIMYLMCIALFIFLVLYTILTILPVVTLNCPYRTPLSAPLWSLLRPHWIFSTESVPQGLTMTEAVVDSALRDTKDRDQHALQWTLDSLTDDAELLPFVEAIPDVIFGLNGFRRVNDHLFDAILGTVEIPSPLVTRICNLIASTQGMSQEDPLCNRRRMAGHRALWALCLMPSAQRRYFAIDQTQFDGALGGLAASATLAVKYQAQRWCHCLLGTVRELLIDHNYSSAHFRDFVLPTTRRLLPLIFQNRHLLDSPIRPQSANSLLKYLERLYAEIRESMPTVSQLENLQRIVAAVHDSHDWAYNSITFLKQFIKDDPNNLADHIDLRLFEPMQTCHVILCAIESNPPRYKKVDFNIVFPPTIEKLAFARNSPGQLDVLVRIMFRMLPFVSDGAGISTYLDHRGNARAIEHALMECNLSALAKTLAASLSDPLRQGCIDTTVLRITTVANSVYPDAVAIQFIDDVLRSSSPGLVPQHSAIRMVRYLRLLRQLHSTVSLMGLFERSDDYPLIETRSSDLARIQQICQGELFAPLAPLFLPRHASIRTVIQSLQHHISNKYISFLSDFFQNMIPAAARITISAFGHFVPPGGGVLLWAIVDEEIQTGFFAAILANTEALADIAQPRSDAAVMLVQLWASNLFWVNSNSGMMSVISGVEPSCLQLLLKSLQRYHTAADANPESEMDTAFSKRLLMEVEKKLRGTRLNQEAHGLKEGDLKLSPTQSYLVTGGDPEEI